MKKDKIYLLVLYLILIISIGINYFSFGSFLYDCGREFLVPELINQGYIPVKEIFLSYFPLSYQINAVLFKIFGSNFDVLRISGVIFSLLCASFIYLSSRFFTDEKKSFLITVSICLISMFNISHIFNWVLGYSYAFIYASSILFVSIYFALNYLKKDKFLYPAFFLLGVCFALKAEFGFVLIPYLTLFYFKKTPFLKIFFSLFLFFVPILFSFLCLKFSISDFISYFDFMKAFITAPSLKIYNQNIFHGSNLFNSLINFFIWFFIFSLVLFLPLKKGKTGIFNFLSVIFLVIFLIFGTISNSISPLNFFGFLPLLSFIVFIISIKKKDAPFIFISFILIFLLMRFEFSLSSGYCAYLLPLGLFVNSLFFVKYTKNFSKILISFLLVFAISNVTYFSIANSINKNAPLETKKGRINVQDEIQKKEIQDFLSFLDDIKDEKSVLILPEGAMYNYVSGKQTSIKYYQLIPNHIEALNEKKIADDLKSFPPDYIIFSDIEYLAYGKTVICDTFGLEICAFAGENYQFKGNIKGGANFYIYELK